MTSLTLLIIKALLVFREESRVLRAQSSAPGLTNEANELARDLRDALKHFGQ